MTDMEDKDISNGDFDSDSPIYEGQGPKADQDDDDDVSCEVIHVDIQVPVENSDGCTRAQSDLGQDEKQGVSRPVINLVNNKEQAGDHQSFDPQQEVESCQTLKTSLPESLCLPKWHADTIDCTRDSGCSWVDEYSDDDDDDDEIRVGHEGKKAESPLRSADLKCHSNGNCEINSLIDSSKMDCSSTGTAEESTVDCRSSASNLVQSEHSLRCETLSCNYMYLDRSYDEDVKKCCELEDLSCKNKNSKTFDEQEHQILSALELQTSSNVSKDEAVKCRSCDMVEHSHAGKQYSLRTRRKNTRFQEDDLKSKPKTPSKKPTSACCKDPKTTCKKYEKKEGISLPVTRRTSPRKRNRIDQVEDLSSVKTVPLVCDENLNSKVMMIVEEQEKNDFLHGKERSSTARSILDQSPGLSNDSEDVDCELDSSNDPVSSQIFTGAPMFSCSKTKTRKQSYRGKGSACQTHENVSAAGEGIPLDVDDTYMYKKEIESTILELEPGHEGEKRTSNEDQSIDSDLNQACVSASIPSNDVLEISNRRRRRKQSFQEQSKTAVTDNEQISAETGEEDKTLKRTRRVNKNCEPSKKQKCLRNKDDVIDSQTMTSSSASVEIPLQTAHLVVNGGSIPCAENDKEATDNIEKLDGPTSPVKRPTYRARRCRSRGRKSANDLINILTAASASALKRVSESASPPSSKENQASVQTDQKVSLKKGRSSSRKGKVTRARQSRKRKYPYCSPGEDDPQLPDSVKAGRDEMNSSFKKADEPNNLTADVDPSQEQCATIVRLDSVSHDDGGGDDDDELMNPVLTPDSKTKDLPPAFNINDVVWAPDPGDKSRWPAVVIEVAGENVSRRVYNVFKTNQAKEHYFQVKSSRYLKPYNCREKETYMEKGKGMTEFNKAVEKANDFIMKIGLGKVNCYEDFFKPSDAYLDSPPPSPDYTSPPSPPLIVGHSSPEYPLHCPKTSQHVIDVDDDDDEEEEEEEEEGGLNDSLGSVKSHCNETSKEITRLKRKWQRKEKRLLEHMRSLQTKEYLVGIQHGKVASHRHHWFLSTNPTDKGRLLRGSFGALINEKKRFETVNYLRDLLISDKSLLSSPRYMMEVALPEALNFAYQKTFRVSKDEAEQLIHMDGQQVIRDLDIG